MYNNLNPRARSILVMVVIFFVSIPLFYLAYTLTTKSDPAATGEYYDRGSKQTTSNNGSLPETYGTSGDTPIYLGVTGLLATGLSKFHAEGIKAAYYQYSKTLPQHLREVSITVDSIKKQPIDFESGSTTGTVTYKTTLDRKYKYDAMVEYSGLKMIRLYLRDSKKTTIFDSGDIDGSVVTN